jgi:hypothetical protein
MFSTLAGLTDNSPDTKNQMIPSEQIQFSPLKNLAISLPTEKIPEEEQKPKINVMTFQEQKNYFEEQNRQAKIDKFDKEFNSKKSQCEAKFWNERTGKFEKHSEVAYMEKEIESMMKDSNFSLKKAKPLDKEIAEQIKKNPEKSKEILGSQIKKIDPREALKDLNQDLVNDILYEDERKKKNNQTSEGNYKSKVKQESGRKDRDGHDRNRDKSMLRENYDKNKSRDVSEAKSSTRDKSQVRGRDRNQDRSYYRGRSKDYNTDYSGNKTNVGRSYEKDKKVSNSEMDDKSKSKEKKEKKEGFREDRSVSKAPDREYKYNNYSNKGNFNSNYNNKNNYSQSNKYSQFKDSRSREKSEYRPRDKSECRSRDKSQWNQRDKFQIRPNDSSQAKPTTQSSQNQNFSDIKSNYSNSKRNRNFNNLNNRCVDNNGNFKNNNFSSNRNFNNYNSGTGNQVNSQQQKTSFQKNNPILNQFSNNNSYYFQNNNEIREKYDEQVNFAHQIQNNHISNPNFKYNPNNFNSKITNRDNSQSQCRQNRNFQALPKLENDISSPNFNKHNGKTNPINQFSNTYNRYSQSPSAIRENTNYNNLILLKNSPSNKFSIKKDFTPSPINLLTPNKSNVFNNNEIDLTGDDDVVMPSVDFGNDEEIENFKRKKMREDLTDLMVNLKDFSPTEDEISNKLLKELKSIANESSFIQLMRCRDFVKSKLSISPENILKEYITFRDKSMNASNEMLILSSFYFMWLYENKVRSKVKEISSDKLKEKEISNSLINNQGNKKDISKNNTSELTTGLRISQASTVNTVNHISNSSNFSNLQPTQGKGIGDILFGENSMCSTANITKSKINEKNRDKSKSPLPAREKKIEKTSTMEVDEVSEKINNLIRGRERSKTPARVPDFAKNKEKKIVIETTQLREKSAEPKRKEKSDKTENKEKLKKSCTEKKTENSKDFKDKSVEPVGKTKRSKSPTPVPLNIKKPQEFLKQKRNTDNSEKFEASTKPNKKRRIEDESMVENEESASCNKNNVRN